MKTTDRTPHFSLAVLLFAAVTMLALSACDSGSSGEDEQFSAPLSLTGVDYQSPDSASAPEEVNPGDLIVLKGQNLNSVQRVYFNGEESSFNSALSSSENLIVSVPNLPYGELDPDDETFNTIRVTNRRSEATLNFPVLPPAPTITGLSNEYAHPGDEVTLYGSALYLAESLTLPGGTTLSDDDLDIPVNGSSATFTLPSSFEEGPIRYKTAAGTTTSAFRLLDSRGVIVNADDVMNWQYWSALNPGDVDYDAAAVPFREGANGEFIVVQDSMSATAGGDGRWWTAYRSINLNGTEWVAPGSLSEPLGNFAMKFELNIEGDWEAGTFRIVLPETEFAANYQPWLQADESFSAVSWEGWRTVSIPMTQFAANGGSGDTASDLETLLSSDGNPGAVSIRFVNTTNRPVPEGRAFAFDNIRVVRIVGGGAEDL